MSNWLSTVNNWLFSEILTHLGFLLALVFLANLLRQRRSPSSTIAWLLVICLPYLGVPLYLMFGGRKINRMARRKSRIYHRRRLTKEPNRNGGTAAGVLRHPSSDRRQPCRARHVGGGCLPAGHTADRGGRSTIHITTYILG